MLILVPDSLEPRNFHHGAESGTGTVFQVWAPAARHMLVRLAGGRVMEMTRGGEGYWRASTDNPLAGQDYMFVMDGTTQRPDPASRFQPEGVHSYSRVVDLAFPWRDAAWKNPALEEYILYELHVGTFTPEGTLASAAGRIQYLRDLGVTAVELMPVAQFPGRRNWGYDGVYPFAVQNSYGGPRALQEFVDACHASGVAVVLDVVYNHLGPEGNYLRDFGPYFTDRCRTPWGPAVNFDGPYCGGVRRFFIENALFWISQFHIDALRLDAVHGIFDQSAYPFLEELADQVHAWGAARGRKVYLIAESNLNDPRLVRSKAHGGFGLDAQWNDDFHHALRTVLTGDRAGYYCDFGTVEQIARAYRDGFVYTGQFSEFRQRPHGRAYEEIPGTQFIVFDANHDQVGNRMLGARLSSRTTLEDQKLAAGAVLLSPFVPLLFMGEEYGETAPFLYFIEHSDAKLIEAVRRGRAEEFAAFAWQGTPPDPQAPETFAASKLRWELREKEPHRTLSSYYRALIRLRKQFRDALLGNRGVTAGSDVIEVRYASGNSALWLALNFSNTRADLVAEHPCARRLLLDSAAAAWAGPGSSAPADLANPRAVISLPPRSLVLYGPPVSA